MPLAPDMDLAALASELGGVSLVSFFKNQKHRRFMYKGDTSTQALGADPRVALGAQGELPWIYLGA